ncbi:hypothetical protein [Synechococcus sp. R55.2]|uniref:hypothetical protein n=1 Tax=Synechococcus sp. R55.2 TaxID=2964496 RepID=UPI0039C403C5
MSKANCSSLKVFKICFPRIHRCPKNGNHLIVIQICNPDRGRRACVAAEKLVVFSWRYLAYLVQNSQSIGLIKLFWAAADYNPAMGIHSFRTLFFFFDEKNLSLINI